MNIFITNTLTGNQYNDARELIDTCKRHDNTKGICFFEAEINIDHTFPCFYMMYDNIKLVSFMSIFVPDEEECEIYAVTHPQYRKKGCFKKLYLEAGRNIKKYAIKEKIIVCEPESQAGTGVLDHMNAKLKHQEYLMSYNMSVKAEKSTVVKVTSSKEENTERYEAYWENIFVGSCKVDFARSHAVIYEFEIVKEYRGRGYGTQMLLSVINSLVSLDVEKILLHVNGANMAARAMYLHHGFVEEEQIDYWLV